MQEAEAILSSHIRDFETTEVPVGQALNHFLAESISADRDFPPFDRVTMDGVGINHQMFVEGVRNFPIESIAAAGAPQQTLTNNRHCIEVMTGAITPAGVSAVIKYEELSIVDGNATIVIEEVKDRQNIHSQGLDRRKGDVIIDAGRRIGAPEIGIAGTVGKTSLRVAKIPKILIVSSGDELVSVEDEPLPHQIRSSNAHTIQAAIKQHLGVDGTHIHLPDDRDVINRELSEKLGKFPIVILLGGSSKGKFDFIPDALENLGIQKHFYKIRQRPGKPFWFGTNDQNHVFALPGNPVSCFMCLTKYVLPWFDACLKQPFVESLATLGADFTFVPDLTYFLQVALINEGGKLMAMPVQGHGSGDLANLTDAEAFLELPQGRDLFKKGEVFPYFRFRHM